MASCQPAMWIRISRTPQVPNQISRMSASARPSIAPWSS